MRLISARELNENPFKLIADEWMLLTAGDKEKFNTMTVSWGGMGILWNKEVVTVYVRPQRYTREFIDDTGVFTLTVLKNEYKSAHKVCGSKSGRDIDKCSETGLIPVFLDDSVTFEQARLTLVCRKIYKGRIDPEGFVDSDIEQHYPSKDYHNIYVGEILSAYIDND